MAFVAEEQRDLQGLACNFYFLEVLSAFVSGQLSCLVVSRGVCCGVYVYSSLMLCAGTFSKKKKKNDTWGFGKFVEISKLKSSPGLLTIRCVLAVIKEPHAECKSNLIVDPPPELPGRLERALKNGRGTDITLLVGGREFNAHRFMLAAQSMVFDAQLFGPMMDKDTRCMEIVDMEPAIFEMLLHYVYTDSLPPCSDGDYDAATLQYLLVAAVRYGLDRLKVMCEGRLCKSIDRGHHHEYIGASKSALL